MRIAWISGFHNLNLKSTDAWLCLGVRGSGKSAFLEHLAELHLEAGNCVLDLFAARSGENLAWLRSKWAREKRVLLLSAEGAQVEVKASGNVAVKEYTQLRLEDFNEFDIIINSCVLYPNLDSEFHAVNTIIDKLWQRREWKRIVYVICREAANLVYSRMKIAENQALAKTFLSYWMRESRHAGCSIGLDSQRFMALDVDVRSLADFLILKAQGNASLPRDMHFVYRYIEPAWLQYAEPYEFAVLTRRGDIGVGVFPMPEWHAREGENVAGKVGVKVVFTEQPMQGVDKGAYKTVGDEEHAQIISMYVDGQLSMMAIAQKLNRSSGTVKWHVDKHNGAVAKLGYCPQCRRAKSPLEATITRV